MKIGYARTSTLDQNLDLQLDALKNCGCEKTYQEQISSVKDHRPQLENCLQALRAGDTLYIWRLDRLGRSLKDLIISLPSCKRWIVSWYQSKKVLIPVPHREN